MTYQGTFPIMVVSAVLALLAFQTTYKDVSFDGSLFAKFVENRVGVGKPVYWYCFGEMYTYPEGKLVAKVEGIDTARLVREKSTPTSALQLSRKVFFYKDPANGAVLDSYEGRPVTHIEYPYQRIQYTLANQKLVATVTQGKAPRIQTVSAEMARARVVGSRTVFSIPLFVSVETPRGKIEAYENYDFIVGKGERVLSWNRFGDLPPAFGTGKCVIQLVAERVDSFSKLPTAFQTTLRQRAPLWELPPADEAEIQRLQQADPSAPKG